MVGENDWLEKTISGRKPLVEENDWWKKTIKLAAGGPQQNRNIKKGELK